MSPKHNNKLLRYCLLALIYVVAILVFGYTYLYFSHATKSPVVFSSVVSSAEVSYCNGKSPHNFVMNFTDHGIVPSSIAATRCDNLTITNKTTGEVVAALGPHAHHIQYPGFNEKTLYNDQSYTFTLYKSGTFPIHDHDDDSLRGTIVVK